MYFVEKTRGINYFKQFDYFLLISILALTTIGLFVLNSATRTMPGGSKIMTTQIISIVIGLLVTLIVSVFDYKDLRSVGFIFYFICIGLLVYVLKWGIGYENFGSSSWIYIPKLVSFQPSEIMKIAFVIVASVFLERIKEGNDFKNDIIKFIFYISLPLGLIMLQPDYGMVMVFLIGLIAMIYIYGIKYKYIFISIVGLIACTPILWFYALNDNRKQRIFEFISPGSDPSGASWQLDRAELAIGSGRLYGSGLYKGIQTQNGSVPIKESDLIFSVIGEELGFIGSILIVILIFIIIFRCIYIAKNSQDFFGTFLVIGMSAMIGFQFIQNIGMCLRLIPVTGLPLPFVSAGGSAMVTNFFSMGIVLSVSMRRKRALPSNIQ